MVAVIVIIWFLAGGTSGTSREGRGLWDNLPGANPVSSKSVPDIKTDKSDRSFWTMLGTSRGPQYPSSYAPEESENPSYTPQEAQFRAPESVHHQPYQSLYAPPGTDSLSRSSYAPELSSPPRYPDPLELSSPPRNPEDLEEHKISKSTRENVSSFLRRIKSPNHDGTNRRIADLNTRADWRERAGKDGEVAAESKIDQVLKINRLAANTMESLQGRSSGSSRRSPNSSWRNSGESDRSSDGSGRKSLGSGRRKDTKLRSKGSFNRRIGVNRRSDDIDDYEEEEDEQKESKDGTDDKRLAAQVNAVAVLDMIKNLQDEIQDIDAQIDSENNKMKDLKKTEDDESDLEIPVSSAAKISAEETMKELTLQKEDTTMKKVIAQMMLMKQIQKKAEENDRLESALVKLGERRKLINSALMKQKEVADEKRKLAKIEIDRQKEIMLEKEKVIQSILQHEQEKEEREKEKAKKKESLERLRLKEKENKKISIDEQAGLLAAHMKLVDRSNNRILARIEQIKLERQKEAIQEQEKVLLEQQAAISALRSLKNQRKKKQKMKKLKEKNNPLAAALNLPARLNLKQSSALLSLSDQERKQVAEWLDLERNAEILQKTDLKIAEKLRAKTAAETIGTSSALKIKNAAQILLESEDDITDDDIDSILGIDSGLSIDDLLNLEDTSLLGLDEDELAFDDYEDDKDYDDDYDEVTYSYEYEDEKDEDYDYEYEEVVTVTKAIPPPRPKPLRPYYQKPKPRPRPQKQYHQAQRYPAPRPSYSYTPAPASYSNYPRPYPRQQSSGAQFLDEVTGLLETAQHQPHITLTGSLRDALLRDVDDHVRTEVNRLPGGRVSTKVSIGPPQQSWQSSFQSNRIQPPSDRFQLASSRSEQPTSAVQPANNQLNLGVNRSQPANSWVRPAAQIDPRIPRRPETRRTSMGTFGDLVSSAEVKEPKERLPIQEISFSEIMGDLLKDKPLPPGLLDNSNQHPGNIRF